MESDSDIPTQSDPLEESTATPNSVQKPPNKKSSCSVLYCYNTSLHKPEMSFFRLPKDPHRAAIWLHKIRRVQTSPNMKRLLVCETHFDSKYITENEFRKRLSKCAVPTHRLPEPEDIKCLQAECTRSAKQTIKGFQLKNDLIIENSQSNIAKIIKLNKNVIQPDYGEKFTDEFKFNALKLYLSSPKTYKVMRTLFNLPPISILYRLYIPSSTDAAEKLIIALKMKVDIMTEAQKQCAVCVGTVDLKTNLHYDAKTDVIMGFHDVDGTQRTEPARKALVVMVRGIFDNWKQAIAFSLLSQSQDYEDVRTFINNIISKLFDIGLKVRVFMSDIESDFIDLSTERKINVRSPFFAVDDHKIYFMYDPLHVIKLVREYWTTHELQFNKRVARWGHIAACYAHECDNPFRLAPQLTCQHIIATHMQSEKDKVKLATEVFSKATAAAINIYAEMKILDESAKETVEWIIMMNQLLEMLDFSNETKNVFSGDKKQIEFLHEMDSIFQNLRVIETVRKTNVTHDAKFIFAFRVTIKALLSLHQEFKTNKYSKYPTIGLSRDCLDIFFDYVHQQYGREPTSKHIQSSMSKMPIFNVFSRHGNKSTDNLDFFLNNANFGDMTMYEPTDPKIHSIKACYDWIVNVDLIAVEDSKENILQHMAAHLLYVGYQLHRDCAAMRHYVFDDSSSSTAQVVSLEAQSPNQTDNIVRVVVSAEFVEFVESLDLTFKLFFETEYERNPLMGLRQHLFSENVTFPMPCECFPLDYIKLLFIRNRINILLEYNNKLFQDTKDSNIKFVINDL